ncbi:oxygen-independent coproporphyrinogen-3 oxidase [Thermanaeromonas toyohensis ToBE]|uniref:Heme chaperone HemW n=1 Tax=Thermanaeromonas toyohensis ToBE TaxID=698762 RepID=A0A1W1VHR0_9FIRM|nr:radical SAM family heme chaperone HemW [Thermanaeromonas toyohensis]SMB92909.1 oxygen-independent coproporphyrinogen-3 oxidase [Thermanaeromonas toyohensis ToBE]
MHLYIHIPFCLKKCNYCDFISYAGIPPREVRRYLAALAKESELVAARFRPGKISTLYLGGGTPTYLSGEELFGIIQGIRNIFGMEEEAEITVEANPGTLTPKKLELLRLAGVNRLSLGAQSFDDGLLKVMGRVHRVEDIYQAFRWAREAGFNNIGLDLIYGLPGQTLSQWEDTLDRALELYPEHLSTYALELSLDSPWGRKQKLGELLLPREEEVLSMYELARQKLKEAGFEHYEISNFARAGFQCRHNLSYWENRDYLGLGAAAASHWKGRRWQNKAILEDYCRTLEEGRLSVAEEEELDQRRSMEETLFLGLRLRKGVSLKEFKARFGEELLTMYGAEIERLVSLGLVEIKGERLVITEKGLPLANEVFLAFV